MVATRRTEKVPVLVTGGSGFLGRHLIQQLADSDKYAVTNFDLRPADIPLCTTITGDLSNLADVKAACVGMAIVFHVATAAPTANNAASAQELMTRVNVLGTANVIAACRAAGVQKLVFTSSASVVFEGKPLVDIDETHPYAAQPMDYYTGTKMEAEQLVLAANDGELATCALRPSGIFGPGEDKMLVPGVADRARKGKMKYIIGPGTNSFDWTYVGNVAHAHLCAADKLAVGSPVAGQAFFITNDEPTGFWAMMGDLCEGLGYERPSVHLPVWLMMMVAVVASLLGKLFGMHTDLNPMRVTLASVQRTMSCAKAKRLLGYSPLVNMRRAKLLTIAGFQHLHRSRQGQDKDL